MSLVCAQVPAVAQESASVGDTQVLRTPLTPRLFAQALTVRNLELTYGRDTLAVSVSMAAAEAALYEPILFANASRSGTERQRTVEEQSSNLFAQSIRALDEISSTVEAGVRQKVPSGGELSLSGRHVQRSSNILSNSKIPLEVNAGLVLSFKQPLLRGAGTDVTETDRRVAELEAQVTQWQYLQQLNKVLAEGLSLFWQAEVAGQIADWRQQLLASTDALAKDAQVRIEAGKLAPRAQLELSRARLMRQADLGRANQTFNELKLRLLSSLDLDAAQLSFLELKAESDGQALPARAEEPVLAQWPPYQMARLRKQQGDLRLAFANNQRRPAVDLVVTYSNSGLANASRREAWRTVDDASYPSWYVGLNMELGAFGNRRADAQWVAQTKRVEQSVTEIAAIRQAFLNDRHAKQMAVQQLLRETGLLQQEVQTRQALLDDERHRFDAGLGLLSTLLQAEQDLIDSRIRTADAKGRLETARLALLLADGGLLTAYGIDTPLPASP